MSARQRMINFSEIGGLFKISPPLSFVFPQRFGKDDTIRYKFYDDVEQTRKYVTCVLANMSFWGASQLDRLSELPEQLY